MPPVGIGVPQRPDLGAGPPEVLGEELDGLVADLLLALAVALDGVEPVHVEHLRGEVALHDARGEGLVDETQKDSYKNIVRVNILPPNWFKNCLRHIFQTARVARGRIVYEVLIFGGTGQCISPGIYFERRLPVRY